MRKQSSLEGNDSLPGLGEQARTVHLTLLLIVLVIFAANFQESVAPTKRAYLDMEKIQKLANDPLSTGDKALEEITAQQRPLIRAQPPYVLIKDGIDDVHWFSTDPMYFFAYSFTPDEDIAIPASKGRIRIGGWETLDEFEKFWDRPPKFIYNPLRVNTEEGWKPPDFRKSLKLNTNCGTSLLLMPSQKPGQYPYTETPLELAKETHGPDDSVQAKLDFTYSRPRSNYNCQVELSMGKVLPIQFDVRRTVREIAGADWSLRPFKETFKDLNEVAMYLKETSLENLSLQLNLNSEIRKQTDPLDG